MAKRPKTRTVRKPARALRVKRSEMVEPVPGANGRHRFKAGNAGRPKGIKEAIPRGIKASVRTIIQQVVDDNELTVYRAIMDGLKGGARNADRYLRLCAEYVDGKPADTLNLNTPFKEDELALAKTRLDKKMDALIKAVLARRSAQP